MLDYYVKYNIVTVIPLLESVYLYNKLPSELNLSKKLISLNYISKSPFYDSLIFSYKKDKNLCIWFSPPKDYTSLFVIPEGFIVYFILRKLGDGLYSVSLTKENNLIIYIKDSVLLLEFISTNDSQLNDVELQYNIQAKHISDKQYKSMFADIWKDPKLLVELRHFLNIDLSKDKLLSFFDKQLYYPLVSIIILYISITAYQSYRMNDKIETLTTTYQQLKEQNSRVKLSIQKHNRQVEDLNVFMKEELYFQDPIKILASLEQIIHKDEKAKIKFLTISPIHMKITITTTDDAIKYLRRLNDLGYFKNVTIEGTYKNKNGDKTYTYSLVLKVLS